MSVDAPGGGILMTMHRLSQGGADRVGILLANGFANAGIPTRLAILRDGGEGERALMDLLHPSVSVTSAGPALGSRHLELARGLRFIRRETASFQPSVVLASSSNMGLVTGLVTGLAARLRSGKRPKYAMKLTNPVVRPHDRGRLRTAYRHRLYGFIFSHYDLVMTLTDAEKSGLLEIYPEQSGRFRTVPNAYISDAMLAVRRQARPPGPLRLLTLARMMPQKRLDVLLKAFARLGASDAQLTIVGDGPLRSELERLARSLGVADRVKMPGFVDDVVPWLLRHDLLVLSSDYEGLPAALLEALACGIPVVTTDCFACAREMFAGVKSCAVTPVGDVSALARAIEACLAATADPAGLHKIAEGYGVAASVSAHLEVLGPLLEGC